MAVAYQDNTNVRAMIDSYIRLGIVHIFVLFLQVTIDSQQVTLNALQVVTLAIKDIISGITISGNKPFAAFSGNMAGKVQPTDNAFSYAVVSELLIRLFLTLLTLK